MATWKTYRISDAIKEIDEEKFVLPVIQRRLVWEEDKMELLFDTLLKGDSFGGIMVIEEEKDTKPLFSFRSFTKDGSPIKSGEVNTLSKSQYFVIDGQQRLQSFYIGLNGTINGKQLYFDLFSNHEVEFEFKFTKDYNLLPKKSKDSTNRKTDSHCWYHVKKLLEELKKTNNDRSVAKKIIKDLQIVSEADRELIEMNVAAFYRNVISGETLGLSLVTVDKSLADVANRQKIVELFRRLNDGGTRLSGFDLVASVLKGFDWKMEEFIEDTLTQFKDIGVDQDNFIKLIFLLQDNSSKEVAEISATDSTFAVDKKDRIKSCLISLRKFLQYANLYTYYKEGGKSFIPLYFIVYNLFHKNLSNQQIEAIYDNYDTGNIEFPLIKKWIYLSLINGIFKSKGAGWIPYKTGVKKLLEVLSIHKNAIFPYGSVIEMYKNYGLVFTDVIDSNNIYGLDSNFIYYLMYDKSQTIRQQDIDHVHPKSKLEIEGYELGKIYTLTNYQLIDSGTNRGQKNDLDLKIWIETKIQDIPAYLQRHLIPSNPTLWDVSNYLQFLAERETLILNKIHENGI